jgi:ABC-2 type transport system permease protein
MTSTTLDRPRTPATTRVGLGPVYRFELVKLLSQWRLRAVFLACLLVPALYTAVVSSQTSLPADYVYGRWMNQSGWAGSLVVLVFMGTLALPLVTCVVSGDIFAVEDRLGTWRHLLVTVRSPQLIFAGKALAALTVTLALFVPLVLSSLLGGLLVVGSHPLPGLDGHLIGSGELARLVALAWAIVIPPTLAFSAIGLLGSVAFGRSPFGWRRPRARSRPTGACSPNRRSSTWWRSACSSAWPGRCWPPTWPTARSSAATSRTWRTTDLRGGSP